MLRTNLNLLPYIGELVDEFDKLYKSLFRKAENHITIINALSSTGKGMTRLDLIAKTRMTNNGNLTTLLNELEKCEFIRSYVPFGKDKKEKLYQLIDNFSLFHFHFMKSNGTYLKDYWQKMIGTNEYRVWTGYAFETVCLYHIDQIIEALGISGSINKPCSWVYRPSKSIIENEEVADVAKTGAQIDLLIDRSDKTISICEMKYADGEYIIDKKYDQRVQDRLNTFKTVTKTSKSLQTVYITPHGLYNNAYARKVKKQITAEKLFG